MESASNLLAKHGTEQAIHTSANKKLRAGLRGGAEQLINVALAVSHTDAITRTLKQSSGLAKVFQPFEAFLFFNRNPGWIDFALERVGPLERFSGPELDGRQPERKALSCDHQTRMHEQSANGALAQQIGDQANAWAASLIGKFSRVMQHQKRLLDRGGANLRGGKVAAEDFILVDARVGKEPIRRLRVGPILTRQWDRLPKAIGH